MNETPEPSDQLPEEAPEEVAGGGDAGENSPARSSAAKAAREQADVRDAEEQATGHPDNAG
jgi:hypothetical protein